MTSGLTALYTAFACLAWTASTVFWYVFAAGLREQVARWTDREISAVRLLLILLVGGGFWGSIAAGFAFLGGLFWGLR